MTRVSIHVSKSPMKILAFVLSLVLLVTSISGIGLVFATDSSAKADGSASTTNLTPVINPDTKEEMFVVNSTFYDYYSDSQVSGAKGNTPGAIDDGVYGTNNRATENSFVKFNNVLFDAYNYGDSSVTNRYPMYLGLFFGDQNSSDNGGFYFKDNASSNLAKNFWLGANSSQKGGGTLGLHANVNAATQGLVDSTLNTDGDITQAGGKEVFPYFSKSFITQTTHKNSSLPLGSVTEKVSFPFRTVEKDGVATYEFDSKYDTVHLTNSGKMEYLGYNKTYNSSVQVLDQKRDDGPGCKPGFFPFNTASDGDSTRLNYGFGVKIDIPFNMTKDGKINGQDIVFNFSGDDDVWVFIDGYLALDIGGAHGEVTGSIDFNKQVSIVSGVKDNTDAFAERNHWYVTDEKIKTDVKSSFPTELVKKLSDTTSSHTLTMFYMERGKIESNMKINFNLPQPNSLTVTNRIDMSKVNDSLKPDTKTQTDKDIFNIGVTDTTDNKKDNALLKDAESTTYTDQFVTGNTLEVEELELTDSKRVLDQLYTTSWDLNDQQGQISNSEDWDDYAVSDGRSTEKDTFLFENQGDAPTTNLTINYLNEVLVGDLVISKVLTDDVEYNGKDTFDFEVKFSEVFGGTSKEKLYAGDYYVTYEDGTGRMKNTEDGIITLKAGEAATIVGVPVQTKYQIKEVIPSDSLYFLADVKKYGSNYSEDMATGTITQSSTGNYFIFLNGKEVPATPTPVVTPEPTVEPATPAAVTPVPTEKPTPVPTVKPTAPPTINPTPVPTVPPTPKPTVKPMLEPTPKPIVPPTEEPTLPPTPEPTVEPTKEPTPEPTLPPTEEPTVPPTEEPTVEPALEPTLEPTAEPTAEPTEEPTPEPTEEPLEIEEPEAPSDDVEAPEETEEPKVEDVEIVEDVPSATPKTGDSSNLIFWLISVVISGGAVILTGRDLFWSKKEK